MQQLTSTRALGANLSNLSTWKVLDYGSIVSGKNPIFAAADTARGRNERALWKILFKSMDDIEGICGSERTSFMLIEFVAEFTFSPVGTIVLLLKVSGAARVAHVRPKTVLS